MPLPDIPQAEYDQYRADLFKQRTTQQINDLNLTSSFLQSSGRKIAGLGLEPVEVGSPRSPILGGLGGMPIPLPGQPQLPQLPQLPPVPQLPAPPWGQPPSPLPAPIPAPVPSPGAVPAPAAAPAPVLEPTAPRPLVQQPQVTLPQQPAGTITPVAPLVPEVPGPEMGRAPAPPARPSIWAQPSAPRPSMFADQQPVATQPESVGTYEPGNENSFIAAMAPTAQRWQARTGIPAEYFLAVNGSESNWGNAPGNMLFGIKATPGRAATGPVGTWEAGVGPTQASFSAYASPDDAYAHFVDLISTSARYQPAWQQFQRDHDPDQLFRSINAAGYATDPIWGDKISSIAARVRPKVGAVEQTISPAAARPVSTAMAQSQFGDRELTASEAYAACGPAAAVRFAQAFGRNPTLKEALEVAREVGWTQQAGMAGIASEQRLMQKLGMDTRLVAGSQWPQFAAEAQSGNPVVISTPGHYFYADGFNPDTGAFHVGRSGLDLRNGKEWMTPAEMESLMGSAQGGLLANNPLVTSTSVINEGTPASLDDVRRQALANLGGTRAVVPQKPVALQPDDPQVQRLDRAVEFAYIPKREQPPTAVPDAVPTPPAAAANPLENLGSLIGNAIQGALQSALGGGPPGGPPRTPRYEPEDRPEEQTRQDPLAQPEDTYAPFDAVESPSVGDRTRAMIKRFGELPGGGNLLQTMGIPDLLPPDTRGMSPSEAIAEVMKKAGEQSLSRQFPSLGPGGLGIFDPRLGGDPRMDIPDLVEPIGRGLGQIGEIVGGITGRGKRVGESLETAFEVARAAGVPEVTRPAGGGVTGGIASRGTRSIAEGLSRNRPERAWDWFVRQYSDRQVDLNHVEQDLQKRLKRKLTDSERVGLLNRLDPTHQSETATEMAIGPAIRSVPDEAQEDLVNLVKLRTMQSIAEGKGKIAEREFLAGGIAPRTEQRLAEANADLEAAQQAYAEALQVRRQVASGTRQTRESISVDAANRRISDTQERLETATEAARMAQAESASEAVRSAPGARLVTGAEQRDLIIAENDVQRLKDRYERLYARNADDPYLDRLARQIGRAESRASRLRTEVGGASATREQAIDLRAERAAQTASGFVEENIPPIQATPELAAARVKLRYEQRILEDMQKRAAAGQQGLTENLARAWQRVNKAQRDVDVATADMPAAAKAQGYAAMTGREFEGGKYYDDVMQELSALEDKYRDNPETWTRMEAADKAIQDYRQQMLQEKVDAGLIPQETADSLLDTYTHWTPTRMLDYMTEEGPQGLPRGNRVNVNDNGFRRYTDEGSDMEMENPIASLIREADQHYGRIGKNNVFNALVGAQEGGALKKIADTVAEYEASGGRAAGKLHPPDYKAKPGKGEVKITGFINGKKHEFITDNPWLHAAVENVGTGDAKALSWLARGAGLVRQVAVSRNPLWLAANSARDAAVYAVRTTAQGGPRAVPGMAINLGPAAMVAAMTDEKDPNRGQKIAAALAAGMGTRVGLGKHLGLGPSATREFLKAYADVLQGLGGGRLTGEGSRELMLGGGGMRGGGMFAGTPAQASEALRRLTRRNAFTVRNAADLRQLFNDVAAFGWVSALGNRFEQAPRVAMRRVGLQRGDTPLEAVIRARDASIDFDRGGNFSREVNRYVPFFNAGAQAGAQLGRLAKSDPLGLAFAGTTLLALPSAATEAWNYSDPQRARDYEDVPDYLKRQGPVLMLPGDAPIDKNGNRVPQHLDFNLQEFAPFAIAGREAYRRITGRGQPSSAGKLIGDVLQQESPISARSPAEAIYGLVPPGPGTIAQLAQNQDLFRGSTIANQFSDENASNLSKGLAPLLEDAVTRIPGFGTSRVRPSQVDFAIRDVLSGLGQLGLNVSDVLTGRSERAPGAPSNIPVVGSTVGRFVRGTGGQSWEDVHQAEQMMQPDIRGRLRALGGTTEYYEPTPVQDTINNIPLRRVEQVEYQRLTNEYFDRNLRNYIDLKAFQNNEKVRETMIHKAMSDARELAQARVLQQIRASGSSLAKRYTEQSSAR